MSSQNSLSMQAPRLFHKAGYGLDKFILVGKHKLHYVEAGNGDPVVLIPGSHTTCRAWNRLMPLLGEHYRILALDYPGVGNSDKPRKGFNYTLQEQTDLIAVMVKQLGLNKVNLIGGLYGGAIAFDFAARYTGLVNKIVSIEGGVIQPENAKSAPHEYRVKLPLVGDLLGRIARRSSTSLEEEARGIKSPVLYLYGTRSDLNKIALNKNIEYLKKYLPHAWIVSLEGGIHDLVLQKPVEVADLILEFLRPRSAPSLAIPEKQK